MSLNYHEKNALHRRVSEQCLQIGALMLDPTEDHVANSIVLAASLLQDVVRLGGTRGCDRAMQMLQQLVKAGILAP